MESTAQCAQLCGLVPRGSNTGRDIVRVRVRARDGWSHSCGRWRPWRPGGVAPRVACRLCVAVVSCGGAAMCFARDYI
eukprot:scaffold4452_cov103-Isochrysis_galbana.AAC.2